MALESSVIRRPIFISGRNFSSLGQRSRNFTCPLNSPSKGNRFPSRVASNCINPSIFSGVCGLRLRRPSIFDARARLGVFSEEESSLGDDKGEVSGVDLENVRTLLKRGVVLGAMVSAVLVFGCKRAFAMEEVANAGYGLIEQCSIMLKNAWPKMAMVLKIFKEQGAILTVLLSLSAFFSMAETSITTLWPWKIRELAEKEPENGVFRMLRSDVTRFLTTILIGTTINLDPLEEYTDEQICVISCLGRRKSLLLALDKCQLGDEVRKKEGKLDSTVSENGENWTVLSVDTATDNLIQITLREHFSNCTVLAIAHRITSDLDSDMVLLLNNACCRVHNEIDFNIQ